MKFLSIFALAASIAVVTAKIHGNIDLEYCKGDGSDSALQLSEVNIEPATAIRGQPIRITAKGSSASTISDNATIELQFKKGIIRKKFKQPICSGTYGIECPTKDVDISFEQTVPKKAPKGDWKVEVKVKGADGKEELACLKGKLRIEKS